MQYWRCGLLLAGSVSASACLAGGAPTRLYPDPQHPLAPEQVATLSGYVQFVDGADVSSLDRPFELLPGCHVIGTPLEWGVWIGGTGQVTSNTGRWTFAVPMRAAYQYEIQVEDHARSLKRPQRRDSARFVGVNATV